VGIDRIIMPQTGPAGCAASREVAQDWQLFRAVESGDHCFACRTWEITEPVVILGRSNAVADHVVEDACAADAVPIVRRFSGGGAVVLGQGCVNYAVALSLVSYPQLRDVARSFSVILGSLARRLDVDGLAIDGGTDLAVHGRKVSGNAQRRGRNALLHHGTLLYDFDPVLATRYLREPVRRPGYRGTRTHAAFLANVTLGAAKARSRLDDALQGLRVVGKVR
jgi:lipoate-protein ligase A